MATRRSSDEQFTAAAFKRAPTVEMSTWYKGILTSTLASERDTGGAFDLVVSHMRRGTEPPPHVHEHEHEFFYVLEGTVDVYVGAECFRATAGECVFLPKRRPHAFKIQSPEIRMLVLIVPGGFLSAINRMAAPAEKLEIPPDGAQLTYATADLEETMKVFDKYGVRILSPDEIPRELPAFPLSPGK